MAYSQTLPAGFAGPGAYTVSAAGSGAIGPFTGEFTAGSPIQIQSDATAVLQSGQPFTLKWTGGTSGDRVTLKLVHTRALGDYYDYAYTDAAAGSLTINNPMCTGHSVETGGKGVVCSFGIPGIDEVIVEVSPDPDHVSTISAPGITDGIQVSWTYLYVFGVNCMSSA